jgi:Xaa-Pro dipeptidase
MAKMQEEAIDALVCISPENVAYTCGFVVPSQPLMRWRHAATVLGAGGRYAMVCVDMEETAVRTADPGVDLHVWAEFGGSAMEAVAEVVSDLSASGGRVGTELRYLPATDRDELERLLPGAEICGADELLAGCRRYKTDGEVELLGRLARIADRAISACCAEVKAGSTEMDIAAALTRSIYENGAQQFKLMIVASGERSQLPNVGPTDRPLQPGDICRIEIFPVINGYHAGVCRTAVVGKPSPDADRIYGHLAECRELVLDSIRPGVAASKVYEVFRAKFDSLGMPPIPFVGHGIGLDLHERPYLADFDGSSLGAGMVLGVEPLVYRTGHGFGMQVKDMVAVGGKGCTLLSDHTATSEMLRIEP